jgi:hypothetical protein
MTSYSDASIGFRAGALEHEIGRGFHSGPADERYEGATQDGIGVVGDFGFEFGVAQIPFGPDVNTSVVKVKALFWARECLQERQSVDEQSSALSDRHMRLARIAALSTDQGAILDSGGG